MTKQKMMMTKVVLVLLCGCGVVSLAGCPRPNGPGDPTTAISLAEGMQPIVAPVYIADEKGFFKEQGLDVKLVPFAKGKLCLDAVLGGQTEAGTVAETPLMNVGFQNQQVVILTTMETATKNIKCVARKDKAITKPPDLKGHKVGVPIGGNAEYFMDLFLKKYGLTRNDVTVVNLQPFDMVGAIGRGDIDASFSWEPHVTRTLKVLGDKAIVFLGDDLYRETFNIVCLKQWAEKNPKTCEKILRALAKATEFMQTNRDESVSIVGRRIQMEPPELAGIWDYYTFKLTLDQFLMDSLVDQAKWAIASKAQTGPVPDYSYMFYSQPLKAVSPGAVTIDLSSGK